MTKRLKTLIYISIFVLIYAIYYWGVPSLIGAGFKAPALMNLFKNQLGMAIEIKESSVKMGLTPSIWLSAKEFELVDKNGRPPLSIKNPKVKILLLPMLIGKVKIAYFSCDSIAAKMKFDKYARFYLGDSLIISNANPIISFEKSKVLINSFKINLNDEYQNKLIKINGDYFNLLSFDTKKRINFLTSSNIDVDGRTSFINADVNFKMPFKKNFSGKELGLNASITNLNLADFSPYFKKLSNNFIQSTSGVVNFDARSESINKKTSRLLSDLVVENLNITTNERSSSVKYTGKLYLSSNLDILRNTLLINKLTINSNGINANISGNIEKILSKNPISNVNLDFKNTKSQNIISLIPATKEISRDINLVALKKYYLYSDLTGRINIKGKLQTPQINGDILSTNAYIQKPISGNTPKATIKLSFRGEKLFMGVFVPTSKTQNVNVNGSVELYGKKNISLDISTTDSVDLHIAETVLNPLHEVLYFDLGPVPIMQIYGRGFVNMKIRGNKENPHIWGTFGFKNSSMCFNDVAMWVKNASGALDFKDTDTHFYTQSASLHSQPIKIDGTCNLKGVLNFNVSSNRQNLGSLLDVVKNSPMLYDIQKMVEEIKSASGYSDIKLNIFGKVKNIDEVEFGKTIFANAELMLNSDDVFFKGVNVPVKKVIGLIKLKDKIVSLDLDSMLGKSKTSIKGDIVDKKAKIDISSDSLYLYDIFAYLPEINRGNIKFLPTVSNARFAFNAKYSGPEKIDLSKLNLSGKILPPTSKLGDLSLKSGNINIKNSNVTLHNLSGNYKNNAFVASANVQNALSQKQKLNANFSSGNFDLSALRNLSKYPFISADMKKSINNFSNISGHVNIKLNVKNNVCNSKIKLNGTSFTYNPMSMPVKINSGYAEVKGDNLYLYKVNSELDSMPILIDGVILDFYKKPNFNIYVNSKPSQQFVEKYVNKNAFYPLKIKGDINYSSRIHGTKESFNTKTEINMQQDSYIYYMGGVLGDSSSPIRVYADANVNKNNIIINNFQYDKLIASQNNKEFASPQLYAKGNVLLTNDNLIFHDFKVKTQNPTDAKIFNILFKKSMIKQGLFTSNISINGAINNPKIIGDVNFTGVNIPILDTTIKDISLDFKDTYILMKSSGEIFANKMSLASVMLNKLSPPYVFNNIEIYCDDLDLNAVSRSINNYQTETEKRKLSSQKNGFDISNIIIKDAQLKADKVMVKNVRAKNFSAKLTLDENLQLALNNFKFEVADGFVSGNFKHNLLNSHAALDMSINNVNANILSDALFDLPNQLFGSLNGEVSLYCNGKTHKTCMDTLGGTGGFQVTNGRMPKLGSLEYLLKASNLVKSGVTGLTINSIIDLVTPLKTGQFESIRGNFTIASGIANSIEIFSKGKDLNLFLSGTYNFSNLTADLSIFGRLSKKIPTVLGPIGNASLNTLFNAIPGLHLDDPNNAQFIKSINQIPGFELNDKLYRIFTVKIYGDINGENYVQSFKWVE